MSKGCLEAACGEKHYGHGYCQKHYGSLYRANRLPSRPTPEERFWAKVDKTSSDKGCWLWTAGKCSKGYGTFRLKGKMRKAHRVSYEWLVGPIPDELPNLDHMCHNTSCVNAEHLRPLTTKQNTEHKARGYKEFLGVSYHRGTGKYSARVGDRGKRHYLGLYETRELAAIAARDLRNKLRTHNEKDW